MSELDEGLPVPRSSKQAKMLGVDHSPISPITSTTTNTTSSSRQSQDRSDTMSTNSAQRRKEPIEVIPPWGWPGSSNSTPNPNEVSRALLLSQERRGLLM